jgi:RNA polymerase sigma-70 factor (ECF subfamily)
MKQLNPYPMKTDSIDLESELGKLKNSLLFFALSFTKNKEDADDLVQDTFLKAVRYADRFEVGTNLKGWLYMILRNTFINDYRKRIRQKSFIEESTALIADYQVNSSRNLGVNKCVNEDIHKALKMLPYEYSYPFIRYFEGYKYHEIARELNIPIGTVKTRIHGARMVLKKNLKMYRDGLKGNS